MKVKLVIAIFVMNHLALDIAAFGCRFYNRRYPCVIGRSGVSTSKQEGDGATPAGEHSIVGMLYRPDRIPPPSPWAVPIRLGDLWSDDPTMPDYNLKVSAPYGGSCERLRRADPLYDLLLVTDWNWPVAVAGRGSCIFVHQWRGPARPTEGCVALRRDHLHEIARRIQPGARLIVRPR